MPFRKKRTQPLHDIFEIIEQNETSSNFNILSMVLELSAMIQNDSLTLEEFADKSLKTALAIIKKAKYGSVTVLKDKKILMLASIGHNKEKFNESDFNAEIFICPEETSVFSNILSNKRKGEITKVKTLKEISKPIKQSLIVPFRNKGAVLGWMNLDIDENSLAEFNSDDIKLAEKFAQLMSTFITYRSILEEALNYNIKLAKSFAKAVELHDSYTKGHSERVAYISLRIGEKLGLEKSLLTELYICGLLHDVGKLFVPYEILNKPGLLTIEEFEIIKAHPIKGSEVLQESGFSNEVIMGIKYHHERLNGTGYPEGLNGEEIPLYSKIIAVADSFDAMVSKRAYRNALKMEEALDEINKKIEALYDRKIVETFNKVVFSEDIQALYKYLEEAENK